MIKTGKFLTLLCAISLMAACGNNPRKPVVYTFYRGDANLSPLDIFKTPVGRKITELTGVKLKITYPQGSDETTEAGIMIAAGEYPDIIYGHNATNQFINAGAFIPLNDLIDKYGKNIKEYYRKVLNRFKDDKGIIYYLGDNYTFEMSLLGDSGFWLPIDLLREAGWPRVEDFDEYIRLIREYVKKHPEINGKKTIGFTALTESWRIFTLSQSPAFLMGYPNDGAVYTDQQTLEAKIILQAPFAKKFYRVLNRLWNEGLMDREIFIQSYDQYLAKIASGAVIGFYDNAWQVLPALDQLRDKQMFGNYLVPFPVVFKGVKHEAYNFVRTVAVARGVGISVSCKNPVGVIRFWDRFLKEDIQTLQYWGIKDVDYTVKDGKYVKNRQQFKQFGDPAKGMMYFKYGFPQRDEFSNLSNGSPLTPVRLPDYQKYATPGFLQEVITAYGVNSWREMFDPSYVSPYGFGWDFQIPDNHPAKKYADNNERITRIHLNRVITALPEKFDAAWEDFQKELKTIDPESFEQYLTSIYRSRAKKWNAPDF